MLESIKDIYTTNFAMAIIQYLLLILFKFILYRIKYYNNLNNNNNKLINIFYQYIVKKTLFWCLLGILL
jgi:predicted negative regulator of RcsB-dependent stress response